MKIFGAGIVAATLIAGCGGGGGGGSSNPLVGNPGGGNPAAPLSTAMLKGSPGFVSSSGMTVYVFDGDLATPNNSQCNGACAGVWPPVRPPAGAMPSGWSVVTRQDSSKQLAFNTRPLYTYTGDSASGQTNGDGLNAFGAVWHIARTAGAAAPSPSPTSTSCTGYGC